MGQKYEIDPSQYRYNVIKDPDNSEDMKPSNSSVKSCEISFSDKNEIQGIS
jgi:hypothetical protein